MVDSLRNAWVCGLDLSAVRRALELKSWYKTPVDERIDSFSAFYSVQTAKICRLGDWSNKDPKTILAEFKLFEKVIETSLSSNLHTSPSRKRTVFNDFQWLFNDFSMTFRDFSKSLNSSIRNRKWTSRFVHRPASSINFSSLQESKQVKNDSFFWWYSNATERKIVFDEPYDDKHPIISK